MPKINLGRVKGEPLTWDDLTEEQKASLKGEIGKTPTIKVGTTETVEYEEGAEVTAETKGDVTSFHFKIPVGQKPPYYSAYADFPEIGDPNRTYIDDTVDPRLMYTWDDTKQQYILTGGAGGADGGSADIPITLPSAGWTGDTAPYSQTLTVPQMRENMTPLYMLDYTKVNSGNVSYLQYAYSLITNYTAGYAEITFYAADLPDRDVPVILKGIPGQKFETADNTILFLVEPEQFALNPEADNRYQATIPVEGMTEGDGGIWDIVRSGTVLSLEESKIAANITDVTRLDGAVRITCLEIPAQRYMMKISGVDAGAESGSLIVAGMQEWFERVEDLEAKSTGVLNQIQEIINPVPISFMPIESTTRIFTGYRTSSIYTGNGVQNTAELSSTIRLAGLDRDFYIIGKIDNANPIQLNPGERAAVGGILYSSTSAGVVFKGSITLQAYYDGVNSYYLSPINLALSGQETINTIIMTEMYLGNMQSKNT